MKDFLYLSVMAAVFVGFFLANVQYQNRAGGFCDQVKAVRDYQNNINYILLCK